MIIICLCLATLIEVVGVPALLFSDQFSISWTLGLAHVLLSLGIGWLGEVGVPNHVEAPRWGLGVLFSGLTLFVPALGAVGVLLLVGLAHRQQKRFDVEGIQRLGERSQAHRPAEVIASPNSDVIDRLMSSTVPVETRLKTLGKLQALEGRYATPLFRHALHDSVEEVRLVAFGMLDKKEQAIQARINRELEWYRQCTDAQTRAEHARVLALAFWELVFEDLVQGDVAVHVLSQARQYAHEALAVDERNPGLWALLGQIALRGEAWAEARTALHKAREYGAPESRVMPYLAELAFREKDFASVRAYFREALFVEDVPLLQAVAAYWRNGPRSIADRWVGSTDLQAARTP